MNRPLRMKDMPLREQPLSEQFRVVAEQWANADGAASLLEELKSTRLSQLKTALMAERGDMSDAKAERIVKSDPGWEAYITDMVKCREAANLLRVQVETLRMQHMEETSRSANTRAEMKLVGGH